MATPVVKLRFEPLGEQEAQRSSDQVRQSLMAAAEQANRLHQSMMTLRQGMVGQEQAALRNVQAQQRAAQSARVFEQAIERQDRAVRQAERSQAAFADRVRLSSTAADQQARMIDRSGQQLQRYRQSLESAALTTSELRQRTDANRFAQDRLNTSLRVAAQEQRQASQQAAQAQKQQEQQARLSEQAMRRQEQAVRSAELAHLRFAQRVQESSIPVAQQAALLQRAASQFTQYQQRMQAAALTQQQAAQATHGHRMAMTALSGELRSVQLQQMTPHIRGLTGAMQALSTATVLAAGPLSGFGARVTAVGSLVGTVGARVAALTAGFVAVAASIAVVTTAMIRNGDEFRRLEGRLTAITNSARTAEAVLRELMDVSMTTGAPIGSSVNTFLRFEQAATQMGRTRQEAVALVQAVQQLGAIGGATTQELTAGMQQLGQGLASGRFQGDELRSVLENLPVFARELAEAMDTNIQGLREMGEAGELIPLRIFEALPELTLEAGRQFEQLPDTVDRATGRLSVAWAAFTADLDESIGLSQRLATSINTVARALAGLTGQADDRPAASTANQLRELRSVIEAELQTLVDDGSLGVVPGISDEMIARRRAELARIDERLAELRVGADSQARARGGPLGGPFASGPAAQRGDFSANLDQIDAQAAAAERATAAYRSLLDQMEEQGRVSSQTAERQQELVAAQKAEEEVLSALPGAGAETIAFFRELAVQNVRNARAAEEGRQAVIEQQEAFESLRQSLQPVYAAQRDVAEGEELIAAAFEVGLIDRREAVDLVARLSQAYRDQVQPFDALLRDLEQERQLLRLSNQERAVEERLRRSLLDLQQSGVELTAAEVAELREVIAANETLRDEMERRRKALQDFQRDYERTIERIADRTEDFLGDSLYDALRGQHRDFLEFFRDTMLRTIADIAAAALREQIVVPIVTQVVGAAPSFFGLGQAPAGAAGGGGGGGLLGGAGDLLGIGRGLFGGGAGGFMNTPIFSTLPSGFVGPPMASQVFTVGNALGGLGIGAGVGGLVSGLTGGNSLAGTGIGAGLGLVGTAIGGPIGGIVGGAVGGLLGGLFGPGRSVGPNALAGIDMQDGVFLGLEGAANNGGDAAAAARAAQGLADALNILVGMTGATPTGWLPGGVFLGDFPSRGGQHVSVGNPRTLAGMEAIYGPASRDPHRGPRGNITFFLGEQSTAAAVQAALLQTELEGLSEGFETIIASVTRTRMSLEEIEEAFAFGQVYDAVVAAERPMSNFQAAMESLVESFEDGLRRAADLSLSTEDFAAGTRTTFDRDIEDAILAIEDPLAFAMEQNERDARARLEAAIKIGADITQVERLIGLERARVIEQAAGASFAGLWETIDRALSSDAVGGLSPLSPMQRLEEAQREFDRLVQLGMAGDA